MPLAAARTARIKLAVVVAAALAVAWFGFQNYSGEYQRVAANSAGPPTAHTSAPGEANCTACHTGNPINNGEGAVTITGLPANYLPGQQIPVTVTTSKEDAVIFGFQLTALDSRNRAVGTYTRPAQTPAQMQIVNGFVGGAARAYVEHTRDGLAPLQFGRKSWTFTWTAPAQRAGKISFYAAGNAANSDGRTSGDYIYTNAAATLSGSAIANFDQDGRSDVAVFRPSNGVWYSLNSTNGNVSALQFGASGDRIVPGDYDADGRTDYAVWRPSSGVWYVQKSSGGFSAVQLGASDDVPVPGDYDGDLKTDYAVWRPSSGVWYVIRSTNNQLNVTQFGAASDKPVAGDFDGDGKTDIAVWRPSNGVWYRINSSNQQSFAVQFGVSTDKLVPGDYDGDGKTDQAVFRPADGGWYLLQSRDGFTAYQFGAANDRLAPADYDGDGITDLAVLRGGTWYVRRSTNGTFYAVVFGSAEDIPAASGYIAQ